MGTYAITLPYLDDTVTENNSLVQAVVNTYDADNKYRCQELKEIELEASAQGTLTTRIIASTTFDKEYNKLLQFSWSGGGSGINLCTKEVGDTEFKYSGYYGAAYTTTPAKFIKVNDKYYGLGAGMAEYDFDGTDLSYTGFGMAFSSSDGVLDVKRNVIVTYGGDPDGVLPNNHIMIIDPSLPKNADPLFGGAVTRLNHTLVYDTGANNQLRHFSYSEKYDKIFYSVGADIHCLDINSGYAHSIVLSTGANEVMGFAIPKGQSDYAYFMYESGADVILEKIDLSNYSMVSQRILSNLNYAVLFYVEKAIALITKEATSFLPFIPYEVRVFDEDLSLDIVHTKRFFENIVIGASPQFTFTSALFGSVSTTNGKTAMSYNIDGNYEEPLSDQHNVYLPVWRSGVTTPPYTMNLLLNVNPVTPYPTVTEDITEDCCLNDLLCELNTKLAKKSCDATNRAIVGRHFGNVWNDSELLEVVKWVTEFDCLSCDDIEALRCVISKI